MSRRHIIVRVATRKLEIGVQHGIAPEKLETQIIAAGTSQTGYIDAGNIAFNNRPERGRILAGVFAVNFSIPQPGDAEAQIYSCNGVTVIGSPTAKYLVLDCGCPGETRPSLLAYKIESVFKPAVW